jgi:hypothetical protein
MVVSMARSRSRGKSRSEGGAVKHSPTYGLSAGGNVYKCTVSATAAGSHNLGARAELSSIRRPTGYPRAAMSTNAQFRQQPQALIFRGQRLRLCLGDRRTFSNNRQGPCTNHVPKLITSSTAAATGLAGLASEGWLNLAPLPLFLLARFRRGDLEPQSALFLQERPLQRIGGLLCQLRTLLSLRMKPGLGHWAVCLLVAPSGLKRKLRRPAVQI